MDLVKKVAAQKNQPSGLTKSQALEVVNGLTARTVLRRCLMQCAVSVAMSARCHLNQMVASQCSATIVLANRRTLPVAARRHAALVRAQPTIPKNSWNKSTLNSVRFCACWKSAISCKRTPQGSFCFAPKDVLYCAQSRYDYPD